MEQTVGAILPQLEVNRSQLEKLVDEGKEQISKKGIEINAYKDEHNISVRGQEAAPAAASSEKDAGDDKASGNRNVLVGNL